MRLRNSDKKTITLVTSVALAFILLFSVICVIVMISIGNKEEPLNDIKPERELIGEMNGVWIASISNIDFPSKPDLTKKELKAELDLIVENTASAGLDTIFFQVRPSADALYDSEIFPVSRYLSTDGVLTLDCLEYLIRAAEKKEISVHAWINPLRASVGGSVEELVSNNSAIKDPQWCTKYADGKIYFNCGEPEVRELIAKGIREIVENYDVSGVVFDDYFYPYPIYETDENSNRVAAAFADDDAYNTYGAGFDDIGDWRRDNVNKLVELSYKTVKKADKKCLFGVSPFGIWKNGYGGETGSVTRGSQSYFEIYCDTLAWAKGEYVDYVAPQLYWTDDNDAASYRVLTEWWSEALEGTGTALLVSHAAYRYDEWESPSGIMKSQVENASGYENYRGSIFYGYEEIANNKEGITDELKKIYAD